MFGRGRARHGYQDKAKADAEADADAKAKAEAKAGAEAGAKAGAKAEAKAKSHLLGEPGSPSRDCRLCRFCFLGRDGRWLGEPVPPQDKPRFSLPKQTRTLKAKLC